MACLGYNNHTDSRCLVAPTASVAASPGVSGSASVQAPHPPAPDPTAPHPVAPALVVVLALIPPVPPTGLVALTPSMAALSGVSGSASPQACHPPAPALARSGSRSLELLRNLGACS